MAGLQQPAWQRHVHPVVVPRREIDRDEATAGERPRQFTVAAEQVPQSEMTAFGLQQPLAVDGAEFADRAVGGAEHGACLISQRPRPRFQLAGEKLVEIAVARRVGIKRLAHVHAIAADEQADQRLGEDFASRQGARGLGQQPLWQQILQQHEQAWHGGINSQPVCRRRCPIPTRSRRRRGYQTPAPCRRSTPARSGGGCGSG